MLELVLLGGFAAYNMATTHSDDHTSEQGDRKIDCYDIWEKITTGPGTGSIQNGQAAAGRLKGAYQERLSTIDGLAKEMDAAWTGGGSEAAQNAGAHPLRVWMEDSGTKLTDSDKYLGEQNNAFTTVHAQVQEVPKDPPKNNLLNAVTPWTTDTDRAIRDYNTKGQANVDAFNTYYKASNDNGQNMPAYSALKGQQENVNIDDGKDGKKKPGDKDGNGTDDGGGERDGGPGGGPGGVNMPGPGGVPSFGGQPATPGGSFDPSKVPGGNYDPSKVPGFDPSQVPGGNYDPSKLPGGSNYTPPNFSDGTTSSGFKPSDLPGVPGFGPGGTPNFSGGGGGGGFGPGGSGGIGDPTAGFGPGGGGFGPGGSTGALPGGAGAGAGGMGRGGMGAGAGGAMGAGGAGAGRGGSTGMGGMGGMGHGAKGQGGGDEERTSKYLLGDDPNEIFGTDELTAPPVIGE
ncbi:hypothetical protein ACIA5G_08880 [Amycolatopsis sp. NPDC051758]|uniref:hypothetical protein n=1 Tax=Amycolatopsis sp. NPDC051758 TaxID=3363935 RepID=UPI003787F83F